MASIFQIRRGTNDISSSIFDGELYLNKSKNSLQVSIGDGNPITLLPLNTSSVGNIHLNGDITASNAIFSGDVNIGGNIFLGNQSGDSISALGVFTTNLVPGTTNLYDVGTTSSVWANVYANNVSASSFTGSFSGSVVGIDLKLFSQSVDNRLDQLETDSGSQNTRITTLESKSTTLTQLTASLLSYTSSTNSRLLIIEQTTASLNNFTASTYVDFSTSVDGRLDFLETVSGSNNARLNNLESKSASVDISLLNINTFTASINTAIDVSDGNTRIKGDLIVDGVQTLLNTTETYIKDKSITLASGSTTSAIADGAGINIAGANVSMSWEDFNQRLVFNTNIAAIGSISASTIIGLNGASVNAYSTSVDSRLVNLETTSGSTNNSITALNTFSSSQISKDLTLQSYTSSLDSTISILNQATSSLYSFTSSTNSRLTNLESTSASILVRTDTLEVFSGSTLSRLVSLETDSGLQNTRIGVLESKATTLENLTSSIIAFTSSTNSRLTNLEQNSASVNTFVGTTYPAFSQSVDDRLDGVEYTASLFGGGLIVQLDQINQSTASLELFTASANIKFVNLEATTTSINTKIAGLETFTSSTNSRILNLETTTSSLNSFSSSINDTIKNKLNTDGVVSGSIQILGGSTIHSGSTGNYQFNSIGVDTASSGVAGEIRASGDITAFYSSDIRLKKNIVPIANALEKVNQISGNTYDWKEGYDEVHSHKGNDVGVIAQEIEEILPQIVTNRDTGFKAVQYEKIIPLLIEAIKELSTKVDGLENK